MDFENLTPFPALVYDVVVPQGDELHVIVARGTYDLRTARAPAPHPLEGAPPCTHVATLATEQAELVFSDEYYGELNKSSVKVESDLAQCKPRCDVIVIGSAHSPTGEAVARVDVGVRIRRLAAIPSLAEAGTLLDHHLAVHGPRVFERQGAGWVLTEPEPFVELPLRYEHAFGGELKVYADDDGASRVDDAHRLDEAARRGHPEGDAAPLAHTTCMYNPLGTGFLEGWYADAARVERWPAPRIESAGAPITAGVFERMVRGEVNAGELAELSPRGLGVVAKPWQPRLKLAGTFDERWLAERWPSMPLDFDMAYWNGAHPDVQCSYLFADELVELWNLLPPGAPGVVTERSSTVCRFQVPAAAVTAGFAGTGGGVSYAAVPIDALLVDLDEMRVSIVWRAVTRAAPAVEGAALFALGYPDREEAA